MKQLLFITKSLFGSCAKSFLLFGLILETSGILYAQEPPQRPFITTWKTDNEGGSNSSSIEIKTPRSDFNYEVDWNNDGSYDQSGITGNVTHDFGTPGTYTIRIRGVFRGINFSGGPNDSKKLLDISQWGDIAWVSMSYAFNGCSNLQISATDLPDLSEVTTLNNMFAGCTALNAPSNIGSWNTENVTSMEGAFRDTQYFDQPIGSWNTSKVTNMTAMFLGATAFNQPIGNWDTQAVTSTSGMFLGATAFNQPLADWITTNVTDMSGMFMNASSFNQPIGNWDTGKVAVMYLMFANIDMTSSGQPLGKYAFNQPIGNWNTENVLSLEQMFINATEFNQPVGNWDTKKVVNMRNMFRGATAFNQPIGSWTLKASVELTDMFSNSGLSCYNYSSTLIDWSANTSIPNNLSLGATGLQFGTNAVDARASLITDKGWTITGDVASGQDCSAALPVTWISFSGKQQTDAILLTWQTAAETNNLGFEIERSSDGKTFERIGFVDGNGDSRVSKSYHFTDSHPFSINYYRLKQIDRTDGKSDYSRIISVKGPKASFSVYPNPAQSQLYFKNIKENTEVTILDRTGKTRLKKTVRTATPIDIGSLPSGIFLVTIGEETQKLVIER